MAGKGGKRPGAGRPKGSVSADKLAFADVCGKLLQAKGRTPGLTVFDQAIVDVLTPVVAPQVPGLKRCGKCGRSSRDYLVNAQVISNTIFRLAEFVHGKPPQAITGAGGAALFPPGFEESAPKLFAMTKEQLEELIRGVK